MTHVRNIGSAPDTLLLKAVLDIVMADPLPCQCPLETRKQFPIEFRAQHRRQGFTQQGFRIDIKDLTIHVVIEAIAQVTVYLRNENRQVVRDGLQGFPATLQLKRPLLDTPFQFSLIVQPQGFVLLTLADIMHRGDKV